MEDHDQFSYEFIHFDRCFPCFSSSTIAKSTVNFFSQDMEFLSYRFDEELD